MDGWGLVFQNPTLKIYQNGNTLVVGIRGTKPTDTGDLSADASIAVGQLASSNRYKNDERTLKEFQSRFPPSQYDYYGVGHSLGGAILDMFIKQGLVKNGVSYNPAVQPQDLSSNSTQNERIYTSTDPLYQTLGRNLTVKPEVRQREVPWYEKLVSYVPWAGSAFSLYKAHTLDNFEGGRGKRGKANRNQIQTADLVRELNSKTPWTINKMYSKAQIKKIQKTANWHRLGLKLGKRLADPPN